MYASSLRRENQGGIFVTESVTESVTANPLMIVAASNCRNGN